jgi:serine/threonine protein kinase, bacterial
MLLNNRYQVIRTLASGGFGETFLAEDTQMPSNRHCVIKLLKPIQNNPQIYQLVQERFQREAAILEDLGGESNQIPALYAYFQSNGQFYLVQEFIEGETLTARVSKQGIVSESAVRQILTSLLQVLEYVHSKRIIHRDIKPDNIILRHRDGLPVLIDFGAVRETMGTVVNSQGNPTSSIVIGTPGYMPSEQAIGRPIYSSDLYSLGITGIYLLTGCQPQELETDSRTGEILWHRKALNVSPTLKAVLDKAIAYHPRERFATAKEMLDGLLNGVVVTGSGLGSVQVPTTVPSTVPVANLPNNQGRGYKGIILSSLITGGLIGGSAIAGIIITRFSQPVVQPSTVNQASAKETSTVPLPPQTSVVAKTPKTQDTSESSRSTTISPAPLPKSANDFYFVADSAYPNKATAQKQVSTLQAQGYSQAGAFWIPDYPNLSGKQLFEVYVAKFNNSNSCGEFLKNYGQVNSEAYCAKASLNANTSPERLFYKQISPVKQGTNNGSANTLNTSQPSPESEVLNYYNDVNSHRYQSAWDRLPIKLQENKNIHPNGYASFTSWWQTVESVDVKQVSIIEKNVNNAKVYANLEDVLKVKHRYNLSF